MSSNNFIGIGGGGSSDESSESSGGSDEEEPRRQQRTFDTDDTPFVERGGGSDSPGDAFDDATRTSRDADQETEATPDDGGSSGSSDGSSREVQQNPAREGTLVSRSGDSFGGGDQDESGDDSQVGQSPGSTSTNRAEGRTGRQSQNTASEVPFVEDREGAVRQKSAIDSFDRELVEGELEERYRDQVEDELESEGYDPSEFDIAIASDSDGMSAEVSRDERADIDWSFGLGGPGDEVEEAFQDFGDTYAPIFEDFTRGFKESSQEMLEQEEDPSLNRPGGAYQIDETWIGAGGVVTANLIQDLPRAPSGALEAAEGAAFAVENTQDVLAEAYDEVAGEYGIDLQNQDDTAESQEDFEFAADYGANLASEGVDFAAENPRRAGLNIAAGAVGEVAAAGAVSRVGRVGSVSRRAASATPEPRTIGNGRIRSGIGAVRDNRLDVSTRADPDAPRVEIGDTLQKEILRRRLEIDARRGEMIDAVRDVDLETLEDAVRGQGANVSDAIKQRGADLKQEAIDKGADATKRVREAEARLREASSDARLRAREIIRLDVNISESARAAASRVGREFQRRAMVPVERATETLDAVEDKSFQVGRRVTESALDTRDRVFEVEEVLQQRVGSARRTARDIPYRARFRADELVSEGRYNVELAKFKAGETQRRVSEAPANLERSIMRQRLDFEESARDFRTRVRGEVEAGRDIISDIEPPSLADVTSELERDIARARMDLEESIGDLKVRGRGEIEGAKTAIQNIEFDLDGLPDFSSPNPPELPDVKGKLVEAARTPTIRIDIDSKSKDLVIDTDDFETPSGGGFDDIDDGPDRIVLDVESEVDAGDGQRTILKQEQELTRPGKSTDSVVDTEVLDDTRGVGVTAPTVTAGTIGGDGIPEITPGELDDIPLAEDLGGVLESETPLIEGPTLDDGVVPELDSDTGVTPGEETPPIVRVDTPELLDVDSEIAQTTVQETEFARPPPDPGKRRLPDFDLDDDPADEVGAMMDETALSDEEFKNLVNLDALDEASDVAAETDDLFDGGEF